MKTISDIVEDYSRRLHEITPDVEFAIDKTEFFKEIVTKFAALSSTKIGDLPHWSEYVISRIDCPDMLRNHDGSYAPIYGDLTEFVVYDSKFVTEHVKSLNAGEFKCRAMPALSWYAAKMNLLGEIISKLQAE